MLTLSGNQRGILWMTLATGCFAFNDSRIKIVTQDLPPFEVIALRGVAASIFAMGLLIASGQARHLRGAKSGWVFVRGATELFSVLCYIVALTQMAIADAVAIGQTAPLMLVIGAALLWRQRIEPARVLLVALGFIGAVLVAQPSSSGVSRYALLAFASPVFVAIRDLFSRKIPASMPVFAVALGVTTTVTIGGGIASFAVETMIWPSTAQIINLGLAALFVTLGHIFIYMAYRSGDAMTVAPFYYTFMAWAVVIGFLVFSSIPDALALCGMGLILASGLAIVTFDKRNLQFKPKAPSNSGS